jgi:hypothetical protein
LVRKIEVYAKFHVFANVMIAITIATVFIYGFIELGKDKPNIPKIPFSNVPGTAIGFSAYAYEGIGLVLPVQDITACPD